MSLACIAVDGTSRRSYSDLKGVERYKKFVRDNIALVTSPLSITSPSIRLDFRHPRVNLDNDGFADLVDVLYHVVRCGLLHESSLRYTAAVIGSPANANVKTTTGLTLRVGRVDVPLDHVWGMWEMLFALVTALPLGGP